jgi:hypothetical protein
MGGHPRNRTLIARKPNILRVINGGVWWNIWDGGIVRVRLIKLSRESMQSQLLLDDPESEPMAINLRAECKEPSRVTPNDITINAYEAWEPPERSSPEPIRQNSEIINRKVNINGGKMEGAPSPGHNSTASEEPKMRKLNSGFIYSVNEKKMKTFLIHSLPKRHPAEIVKEPPQPIKESSPSKIAVDMPI